MFLTMWRRLLTAWTSPRLFLRRILALDDTPHAVALGAAVGMLFGLTPTVGLQTIEVILFAVVTRRLFYFNRAAALILIYISNPLTVAPIYYGLYQVGSLFVTGHATLEQFQEILVFDGLAGWWQSLRTLATDVGTPLAIGTLVVAPAGALLTYPLTRVLLQWYRRSSGFPLRNPADAPTTSAGTPVHRTLAIHESRNAVPGDSDRSTSGPGEPRSASSAGLDRRQRESATAIRPVDAC